MFESETSKEQECQENIRPEKIHMKKFDPSIKANVLHLDV